jgi:hypothetical protein
LTDAARAADVAAGATVPAYSPNREHAEQAPVAQVMTLLLMGKQSLDLDDYVTNKSLDGLFYMVGEEEKKIRTNPAARTTDLLKTVFGK